MGKSEKLQSNHVGNNHKSLHLSVEASLKKLQTDYIDLVSILILERLSSTSNADTYLLVVALGSLVGFHNQH